MIKGTEKQVKWAEDIMTKLNKSVDQIREALENFEYKNEKQKTSNYERFNNLANKINSYENAADIINDYKSIEEDEVRRLYDLAQEFEISARIVKLAEDKIHDEAGC